LTFSTPFHSIKPHRAVLQAGLDDPTADRSLLAYALSLPEELTLLGEMEVCLIYIYVCMYMCVCMCVYVCVCMYVCLHVCFMCVIYKGPA
jgi:hypothetical protein